MVCWVICVLLQVALGLQTILGSNLTPISINYGERLVGTKGDMRAPLLDQFANCSIGFFEAIFPKVFMKVHRFVRFRFDQSNAGLQFLTVLVFPVRNPRTLVRRQSENLLVMVWKNHSKYSRQLQSYKSSVSPNLLKIFRNW